jgi:proteasome accessory factor A
VSGVLFGLETEYALFGAGLDDDRRLLDAAVGLVDEVCAGQPWLPDRTDSGAFLSNGARLYVDCGRHPEYATPECRTPWELVAAVRAGDRLLERALAGVGAVEPGGGPPELTRCNVDYSGAATTWGSHESYLHRAEPETLGRELVPHLVSRVLYTGAGGFDPLSPGVEFTLSPRAGYLVRERAKDSTTMRGLLHDRDEPHSGTGTRRLHLLCGESLCSDEALLVRVGATALVVRWIELGGRPGEAVALADPLAALGAFARDPDCRVAAPLARGGRATALEIQRHYLAYLEAAIPCGRLPDWAPTLCAHWRRLLDRLAAGRAAVETTLDWAIKLALYRTRCPPPLDWERLAAWTRVLRALADLAVRDGWETRAAERLATADARTLALVAGELARAELPADELDAFLARRAELGEADFRFAQLGPRGVFAALDRAGRLAHRVVGEGRVEHATRRPPPGGRAQARGRAVGRLAGWRGASYVCDWARIVERTGRPALDLADPFDPTGRAPFAAEERLPSLPGEVPVAERWPTDVTGVP